MTPIPKPNCYNCVHRMTVPGSRHSRCNNWTAEVTGNADGIEGGWFSWPVDFDPVWLESCDGFSACKETAEVVRT